MRYCALFALCLVALPHIASAQWIPQGVPLCTASGEQRNPLMTSDDAGGAIVGWRDQRNGNEDVYAQRISNTGAVLWTADGVAVCTALGDQSEPNLIPDGSSGAILVWYDQRDGDNDIYVQRLDASGDPLWTANGVPVDTLAGDQRKNARGPIVSDGAGGAIVVWFDFGSPSSRVHAQKINSQGVMQWANNGIEVSPSAAGSQGNPVVLEDGAGGAFVVWTDSRNGNNDIYAQRLNSVGTPLWFTGPDNGIAVCTATDIQRFPVIAADGLGGFVVVWEDWREPGHSLAYAQRVNGVGAVQWAADGVPVAHATHGQTSIVMAGDEMGGWLVAWQDDDPPFDNDYDVYAQRLGTAGDAVWTAGGVTVCTAADRQEGPKIVPDGNGGAYVTWFDMRDTSHWHIYSQRLNETGQFAWDVDGVPTCDEIGDQVMPSLLATGDGGAIAAWYDNREVTQFDIYASRVTDTPNAVAITSFEATAHDGVVVLRSSFRSDLDVQAVNIYRAAGTSALLPVERVRDAGGGTFAYEDARVTPGETYRYQIGVVDADGEFLSPIATVTVDAIALALEQNRPNPFNPTTTIHFVLPIREHATLAVYDTGGRKVRTLVDQMSEHGGHDVAWDGRDDAGAAVGSGVYFYRLTAGKHSESKKMILLK